ncbi:helix-hairpin-helix domain-containing protein [Spirillospora sp. NPDC048911]|uniref:helix-hairpin-helix domain-containing protein n=1 Tax=Spirillospora sp. NPDC048911 TaxID=3364527 RepID=UPI00371584CE
MFVQLNVSHGVDGPYDPGEDDPPVRRPRPHGGRGYHHPGRPPAPPGWRPPYPMPPVPPMAPMAPVPPPAPTTPTGILWAFVPFLTFGFGTPFSFLYAAVRRGSASLGATAAGYGVGLGMVLLLTNAGDAVLGAIGAFMLMMLWIAGTVHAFAVRPSVFPRSGPRSRQNEYAIHVAKYRRMLREDARLIVSEDPALAHELHIGRPDLPRAYDDGGLIDVNHAPAAVLSTLPGITTEQVERILRRRDGQGSFISAEELAVDADLPPDLLPHLTEYAIFLP